MSEQNQEVKGTFKLTPELLVIAKRNPARRKGGLIWNCNLNALKSEELERLKTLDKRYSKIIDGVKSGKKYKDIGKKGTPAIDSITASSAFIDIRRKIKPFHVQFSNGERVLVLANTKRSMLKSNKIAPRIEEITSIKLELLTGELLELKLPKIAKAKK
jgi:hypothetical protein